MNSKKSLTLVLFGINILLVLALLFFVVVPSAFAASCFTDTSGHWAETYICWMFDHGITAGYPDGTYRPANPITRAEMAVFIQQLSGHGAAGPVVDADTVDGLDASAFYTQVEVDALLAAYDARITALEGLLASVTTENSGQDVVFTGVNVHVRNGAGGTEAGTNGLGNLIVGYNEARASGSVKTGSHNLVVGRNHNYSSYGGVVAGYQNTISGIESNVTGGLLNVANGVRSSVSGGMSNTASGGGSSVCGGGYNIASGVSAAVLGGGGAILTDGNEAWADYSVVAGGVKNVAGDDAGVDRSVGLASAVLGGSSNTASQNKSSVSGGYLNTASGLNSSVSGGMSNTASGVYSSVSGGYENLASNTYASVSGGHLNTASSSSSSVSGGYYHNASGTNDWRAGSLFEDQ